MNLVVSSTRRRRPEPLLAALAAACLLTVAAAQAQQADTGHGIGYPSVAAALQAFKARGDVRISERDGWTVVEDPADQSVWSFTPPGHPAHPSAVKRYTVERDGAVSIEMRGLCHVEKAVCDRLMAGFEELNQRTIADVERRSNPPQGQWAPSEAQKNRAMGSLASFLRATDEARHRDAYAMLTPGMKALMSFERFVSLERRFREQSGGEPSRSEARVTWYKDPPQASAPGIYAAFNIRCSFRKIARCEEVVILHEQADGEFLVLRQERNFVDTENERKLRELQDRKQGS